MNTITLTPDEVHLAASHAILRRHRKLEGQRKDREQNSRSTYDNEIMGAAAELAVCKFRNLFWSGATGIRARDGGKDVEVRWTHHENTGGLVIYPKDDNNAIFVLCDGYAPTINLVGWIKGEEAKGKARAVGSISIVPRERLNTF
jgi:hypothetical protein